VQVELCDGRAAPRRGRRLFSCSAAADVLTSARRRRRQLVGGAPTLFRQTNILCMNF